MTGGTKISLKNFCKKLKILTEAFARIRYSPDVTYDASFFSLTILPFLGQVFRACLHLRFKLECTKYANILVQQGHVYATGRLYLKSIMFCLPEV